MKRLVVISLTLLVLLLTSASASAAPIYGDDPNTNGATLMVQKWISNDEIQLGESITVNVNISNIGKGYAYNLTISEPSFSDFSVESDRNYSIYDYVALGNGAVITYEYTITPKTVGEYTIEPTKIDFVNLNGSSHEARSSHIPFQVYKEQPPQETEKLWRDVFWFSIPFAIVPIIIYYANEYFKR